MTTFYIECNKCSTDSVMDADQFTGKGFNWLYWECPHCGCTAASSITRKRGDDGGEQ